MDVDVISARSAYIQVSIAGQVITFEQFDTRKLCSDAHTQGLLIYLKALLDFIVYSYKVKLFTITPFSVRRFLSLGASVFFCHCYLGLLGINKI